ncbi:hypothetical protein [Nocardia bovistercoris]|uniref:hypothetical protein n=1 Tax=Nocardia bovistercoris TaxID=2785916 RepID=UPI0038CDC261
MTAETETSDATELELQSISLWTGPVVGGVLLLAFLAFPGFYPPMSPADTAEQVAEFYSRNQTLIRFSMITLNLCGIMLVPYFAVIVVQMKRMANQTHIFAYCYLTATVSGATIFALADIFFLVAAFRPERAPELIMLLNDLAWITFIAPVGMLVAQNLLLAAAIYFDNGPEAVFPRWVGHFAAVTAVAMAPAVGAAVFTEGPLAWNGAIAFWLRNAALVTFLVIMFPVLRGALRRQAAAGAPA